MLKIIKTGFIERILNKHTKKGIDQLLIAMIFTYLGFSESFIDIAINYNWDFVAVVVQEYRKPLIIIIITLILIAGFNIFRREYPKIHLSTLQNERDSLRLIEEILTKKIIIKKLEKDLENGNL